MARKFLAAALMSVLALGCAVVQVHSESDITLRVGNYGGQFTDTQRKFAGALFTNRTGVKVQYIDANPADHVARIIASRGREPPYDVVYLDDEVQANAITAGVLVPLKPELVANVNHVFDQAKNTKGYGPGVITYVLGICYNKDKYKAAGIAAPKSWADLWDPKLAGKLMLPSVTVGQGRMFLVAATRMNGGNEASLSKGLEKIAELKYHSIYTSSAQIEALFSSGDIWAAPFLDGRCWGSIDKGLPLGYVLPPEGGIFGITMLDVVKGTKHEKEAFEYINTALDPLSQLGQAWSMPFGPTTKLLAPILEAYPEYSHKFTWKFDDLRSVYHPDWAEFYKHQSDTMDEWNRKVVR
jgi:putative spermidine/putrescine transport system substrate-binding protein